MGLWETLALIWYPCKDFPFRTTQSGPLSRNDEIRPKTWPPEIPLDLGLRKNPICQTLSKAIDIVKTLAILSVTTLRRSVVEQEGLKPH